MAMTRDADGGRDSTDAALHRWVPAEDIEPVTIHKAMRYSLFAGGKRIRPLLAVATAEAISGAPAGIESCACSLELIHTYSLIHDDLPALPRYEVSASTTDEQAAQLELLPATHYVVRKRVFNPFSNRWLQRLRDEGAFKDEEVIVFGVATDYCVREAVLGLIEGGATVSLVGDAIKGVAPESTTQSHSHFNSLGVAMVSSDEVLQLARKRALEMPGA